MLSINLKSLFLGALAFFGVSMILAFFLAIPDEALFEEAYNALAPLWRGDLSGDPRLFTAWVLHKMIFALGVSLLFQCVSPALTGSGWRKGALFGLMTCPLIWATYLGLWTLFSLPGIIWIWWGVYYLIISVIGGAAMGGTAETLISGITKSPTQSPQRY